MSTTGIRAELFVDCSFWPGEGAGRIVSYPLWRCGEPRSVRDWREYTSAGEGAVCLLLGADRKQAGILRRYCGGLLHTPLLAKEVERQTDDEVLFRNGASLGSGH